MNATEEFDYHIEDNFDARHLYDNAIFFAKMINCQGIEFVDGRADKENHAYEESKIEINGNAAILHLNTPHKNGARAFGRETLDIKFEGNEETKLASKKRLEGITGIKINEK